MAGRRELQEPKGRNGINFSLYGQAEDNGIHEEGVMANGPAITTP